MTEIDKKARSTIILSLGDSVIREVVKEKTIAGLWALGKTRTTVYDKVLSQQALHQEKDVLTEDD